MKCLNVLKCNLTIIGWIIFFIPHLAFASLNYYIVDLSIGFVEISNQSATNWQSVLPGSEVFSGDMIRTGEDSYCELIMPEKGIMRIEEKSEVTIEQLTTNHERMKVGVGAIFANIVGEVSDTEVFEVETSTAVVGIRGTQFAVEVQENLDSVISVVEGKAKVRPNIDLTKIKDQVVVSNIKNELEFEVVSDQSAVITFQEMQDIREKILAEIEDKVDEIEEKIMKYKDEEFTGWQKLLGEMGDKIEDFISDTGDKIDDIKEKIDEKLSEFFDEEEIQAMIEDIKEKIPLEIKAITGNAKEKLDDKFNELTDEIVKERIQNYLRNKE